MGDLRLRQLGARNQQTLVSDLTERLAEYDLRRLDGRQVQPWDLAATGRDAGINDAAAIVTSALLELACLQSNAQDLVKRQRHGIAMLEGLCRDKLTG
ncbi:hypothetical protein [Caballeronia sp. GAFFF2]|uniref:hypothetical protein n=1 Tax=Caballeronia sp. GAFFF2 TaxID=2921741 RepID=UPI00202980B9|nr:hypothetical protein [Caballeronia sp. GAFFF2]